MYPTPNDKAAIIVFSSQTGKGLAVLIAVMGLFLLPLTLFSLPGLILDLIGRGEAVVPLLLMPVCFLVVVMNGLFFLFALHAWRYSGKPVLTISDAGVSDHTRPWSPGFIPWHRIEEIWPCEFYGSGATRRLVKQRGMAVRLRTGQDHADLFGTVGRLIRKLQKMTSGADIVIRERDLRAASIDELVQAAGTRYGVWVGTGSR